MAQIRDLSVALKNGTMDPNDVKITHLSHAENARRMARGVCLPADLIDPFCANDHVETLSHAGTHVDAPWHFGPVVGGQPAKKIDEVPLEWCYGNGVLLDFSRAKKSGRRFPRRILKTPADRVHPEADGHRAHPYGGGGCF